MTSRNCLMKIRYHIIETIPYQPIIWWKNQKVTNLAIKNCCCRNALLSVPLLVNSNKRVLRKRLVLKIANQLISSQCLSKRNSRSQVVYGNKWHFSYSPLPFLVAKYNAFKITSDSRVSFRKFRPIGFSTTCNLVSWAQRNHRRIEQKSPLALPPKACSAVLVLVYNFFSYIIVFNCNY